MSILSRLRALFSPPAKTPISNAPRPWLDERQQLIAAQKTVALAISEKIRLWRQYTIESEAAKTWEHRERVAMHAWNDELARQARCRKQEYATRAEQFQRQWLIQKQRVEEQRQTLEKLKKALAKAESVER